VTLKQDFRIETATSLPRLRITIPTTTNSHFGMIPELVCQSTTNSIVAPTQGGRSVLTSMPFLERFRKAALVQLCSFETCLNRRFIIRGNRSPRRRLTLTTGTSFFAIDGSYWSAIRLRLLEFGLIATNCIFGLPAINS